MLVSCKLSFLGRSSPVVASTPPQTRKGTCLVAEESFNTYHIRICRIGFELCMSEKKKEEEDEQN